MKNLIIALLMTVSFTALAFTPENDKFDNPKYDEAKIEYAEMVSNGWDHVVDVVNVEAWKEYTLHLYISANTTYTSAEYEFRYHETLNKWYMSVITVDKQTSDVNFANAGPNCDWLCGTVSCPPGQCCHAWWLNWTVAGDGRCVYECIGDEQ